MSSSLILESSDARSPKRKANRQIAQFLMLAFRAAASTASISFISKYLIVSTQPHFPIPVYSRRNSCQALYTATSHLGDSGSCKLCVTNSYGESAQASEQQIIVDTKEPTAQNDLGRHRWQGSAADRSPARQQRTRRL